MKSNLTNKEKLKSFTFIFDGNSPICYSKEQMGKISNINGDFVEVEKFGYNHFYICNGWYYPVLLKENPNMRETVHIGTIPNSFSTGDSVRIEEKNMC
jgi:hypothetical protein